MSKSLPSILAELLRWVALSVISLAEPLHLQLTSDPRPEGQCERQATHGVRISSLFQRDARFLPVEVERQEGLNRLGYF
jgi:hypothetical protein